VSPQADIGSWLHHKKQGGHDRHERPMRSLHGDAGQHAWEALNLPNLPSVAACSGRFPCSSGMPRGVDSRLQIALRARELGLVE
jgi:hypothetical protein